MRYKVVGPPGTGKTRRLLNEVHKYVKNGIPHDQIGYFAFTRKAAEYIGPVYIRLGRGKDTINDYDIANDLTTNNITSKFISYSLRSFLINFVCHFIFSYLLFLIYIDLVL